MNPGELVRDLPCVKGKEATSLHRDTRVTPDDKIASVTDVIHEICPTVNNGDLRSSARQNGAAYFMRLGSEHN